MHYPSAIHYLYSFLNFEVAPFRYKREFNLKRMNALLEWTGHPERKFAPILIVGTNGKGSTANYLASILSANRHNTGLYTSPHLSNTRERIRLNGDVISENDFAELMTAIRLVVESRRKEINLFGPITFFEVFTLLAALYFAKKNVRFAIFEVGMGGRLDATNAMNPVLSVVTPIGLDHMEHLGTSLKKIAQEKAAVIQRKGRVISAGQQGAAKRVIQDVVRRKKAHAYYYGPTYRISRERYTKRGSRFDFEMQGGRLKGLTLPVPARFQVSNAAEALAAARVLERDMGAPLVENRIREGLRNAFWPGRFEVLKRKGQTVVLDGAHNQASAKELCETLRTLYPKEPKIFIVGTSREKNLAHVLSPFASVADFFVVTKSANPRAQELKVIIEALNDLNVKKPSLWASGLDEALDVVDRLNFKKAMLVVTGSLFLVGEARERLRCRKSI